MSRPKPSEAIGYSTWGEDGQIDRIDVVVKHDPRSSYARSVIPCAVRYFRTQVAPSFLGQQWSYTMSQTTDYDDAGLCLTAVEFRKV